MEYKIADHIAAMKPSAIREIFKVLVDPTVISLAAGSPDPVSFPKEEMAKIGADIFLNEADVALQYGTTEGYPKLRELTAKRMKEKYNVGTDNDDILITTGGQQSISLFTQVMLNPGDVVVSEDPSFIGALNGFRSMNAKLMSVPMDDEGMRMDKLEELLQTTPNVKFIYVIPTFQNPTGRTMSLERRKQLLEMARKYDVLIVEDNPYFELRYEGEFVPTIKSMDTEGRVIYLGTISKIFAPGLRIGWICAPVDVLARISLVKQGADLCGSTFDQVVVEHYFTDTPWQRTLQKFIKTYGERRDAMLAALEEYFPPEASWTHPEGGFFLWVTLPKYVDTGSMLADALEAGVTFCPGDSFYVDGVTGRNCMRLNFSYETPENITEAIRRLAKVIEERLELYRAFIDAGAIKVPEE